MGMAWQRIVARARISKCCFVLMAALFQSGFLYASVALQQEPAPNRPVSKPAQSILTNPAANKLAQESAPAAPQQPSQDPLGRSTPYGCVFGFLNAVTNNNLTTAVQYLHTDLPKDQAEQLAVQLKAVMDENLSTSLDGLSREESGNLNDNLEISHEKIGVVNTPSGDVDILLERVQRDQEPAIWLFSADTLAQIPDAYAHLQRQQFAQHMPEALRRIEFLGLPLWRWTFIVIAILLAILLSSVVTRLLLLIFGATFNEGQLLPKREIVRKLKQPIRLLLLSLAIWTCRFFSLSVLARHRWTLAARVLFWLALAWLLISLANLTAEAGKRSSIARGLQHRIAIIVLAQRLLKITAAIVVLMILLREAGVNISAMVAGLGIGGIALALAAQNTLADLFGGISIVSRETIRVGDYCRLAGQLGIVEDIGLSSTRLRTLDRTVIWIPNAKAAQLASENFALRDKFLFHHTLSLRFDTPQPQIERVLAEVGALLAADLSIQPQTNRVNLIGLQGASYQIEIFAYIMATDYNSFIARQQDMLLRVLSTLSDAGARLAFPSSTTYLETSEPAPKTPGNETQC
jgi:MscS family membrane protein